MTTTALISVQRSAQRADERVMRTVEGETTPFDVLSPELALVDERLAAGARARLPDVEVLALRPLREPKSIDDILAATARRLARLRLAPPASPSPPAENPPRVALPMPPDRPVGAALTTLEGSPPPVAVPTPIEAPGHAAPPMLPTPRLEPTSESVERAWGAPSAAASTDEVASDAARRLADVSLTVEAEPGPRRRQIFAGVAASCAAVAISLLVADRALDRDTVSPTAQASVTLEQPDLTSETPEPTPEPEPMPTTAPDHQPPPTSPAETPKPPGSRSPGSNAVSGPRTFAWAPVPNASAYHVELFRQGKRIFSVNTTRPNATVPASWAFKTRKYRLEPAEYRWYVWPVVSGRRLARAVVQARLVVSPS